MSILAEIIAHKEKEVAGKKALYPAKLLEKSIYFETEPVSFRSYLLREDLSGIIAEYKRKSPSKGMINEFADPAKVTLGYMQAGASALSVLTDENYFGGKSEDLTAARKFNFCPILRKDFIVDEYQIVEAKSIGADVILLIAAALDKNTLNRLAKFAKSLGLEVLMEIHSREELDKVNEHVDVVGVNNRNLKDFTVSIQNSMDLAPQIPNDFVKISESGISSPASILKLKGAGFRGFLIGETFMKTSQPHLACANFIKEIQKLEEGK